MRYQVMGPLSEEEFAALKADIAERGVLVPVVLDADGEIIDGHHRMRAVAELREEGRTIADPSRVVREDLETDAEKRDEAWRLNMQRRHLNRAQKRDIIAAKLKESPEWANNRIASLLGVDGATVSAERFRLETASEIRKLDTLIGADGKEYPRHYTNSLEVQARYLEERKRGEIRRALRHPISRHRSDAGIAEDLDVSVEEVTQQRKSLAEQGRTLGEALEDAPPERLRELGEELRENDVLYKRYRTLSEIHMLWLRYMSKHAPEDCAREELAQAAGERAESAVAGRKPRERLPRLTPEAVRGMREWLDRYAKAVEEGSRPGLRKVK